MMAMYDSYGFEQFVSQGHGKFYKFESILANVPGPSLSGIDPREVQYSGCSCNAPACSPTCPCIMRFGPNYTPSGKLIHRDDLPSDVCRLSKPIFECNASCLCGEDCPNRVVQNGTQHKMEIFRTLPKGLGLRPLETIEKDAFVCEYAGEVLSREEATSRTKSMQQDEMNYLFVLNEAFGSGKTSQTYIDARLKGSIARFINHSCEPNLYLAAVRVDNEIPRIAMFAKRDIMPGEELTYHYCAGNPDGREEEVSVDKARKKCYCGSSNCQSYLPTFDCL